MPGFGCSGRSRTESPGCDAFLVNPCPQAPSPARCPEADMLAAPAAPDQPPSHRQNARNQPASPQAEARPPRDSQTSTVLTHVAAALPAPSRDDPSPSQPNSLPRRHPRRDVQTYKPYRPLGVCLARPRLERRFFPIRFVHHAGRRRSSCLDCGPLARPRGPLQCPGFCPIKTVRYSASIGSASQMLPLVSLSGR